MHIIIVLIKTNPHIHTLEAWQLSAAMVVSLYFQKKVDSKSRENNQGA